jgi:hypothetical protein
MDWQEIEAFLAVADELPITIAPSGAKTASSNARDSVSLRPVNIQSWSRLPPSPSGFVGRYVRACDESVERH